MAKKLLNEAAVRRFQSLANISPINEMNYNEEKEDGMKEYMTEQEDDMPGDDAGMDDMEAGMDDMGEGMQLTEEEAEVLIELGKRLEAEMGAGMDDMEGGMEDAGMDAEAPEAPEGEEEEVLDEMDIMEALAGISYIPSQSEVVNEVAQRVARRLKEAKLHESKLNRALGRK